MIALSFYGIILLPNIDNFVDMTTIFIFHTKNPSHTLLADMYYYFSLRHEKRGGTILCCAPLLYIWLLTHFTKKRPFIDQQSSSSWPQRMGSLRAIHISQCSRDYDGTEIVFSYGDFPNIPLIGSIWCINSNSVLSLRQIGYLMEVPPKEKMLEAFVLHGLGDESPTMFKKIRKACGKVNRKGKVKLGKKNCITREPYCQWIRKRV